MANPLHGAFCELHQVNIEDAQLIFDLRTKRKNNYLRRTDGTVNDQRSYLRDYFERFDNQEEIYYKIKDLSTEEFCGVLRITEIQHQKFFNWQSFVVSESASPNTAIDSMMMVYRIGFEYLLREQCGPWHVDKNFTQMMKIHEFIKMAKVASQDDVYFSVCVKRADYLTNIVRFNKMNYGSLGGLL